MTDKIIPKVNYKSILEKLISGRLRESIEDEEFCIPCNNHVYDTEGDLSNHSDDCPYRQAVELLQADDRITGDKLVKFGFKQTSNKRLFKFYTLTRNDICFSFHKDNINAGVYISGINRPKGVETMTDLRDLVRLLCGKG